MGSSTTTRNFGMRRFTNLVREGRFRAPAGVDLKLGTAVEPDPTSTTDPQEVKQSDAVAPDNTVGGAGVIGLMGVLWYEHDAQSYEGAAAGTLLQDYDTAPRGRMVQVLHGSGAKVWFRNTAAATPESGLNFPSARAEVVMVNDLGFNGAGNIALDDLLGWVDASTAWGKTTVLAEAVFRVSHADNSLNTCDAEFLI